MEEIWKPAMYIKETGEIIDYSEKYEVSNHGNMRSKDYRHKGIKHNLKLSKLNNYYYVGLPYNGKMKLFPVHRIVAFAFLPNPYNFPIINHKDENPSNNVVYINDDGTVNYEKTNLEWCTYEYNNSYGTRIERLIKSKINGKKSKPVFQYDLDENFIQKWPSFREVQRQMGYSQGNLYKCCRGIYKQAYNYIWRYE